MHAASQRIGSSRPTARRFVLAGPHIRGGHGCLCCDKECSSLKCEGSPGGGWLNNAGPLNAAGGQNRQLQNNDAVLGALNKDGATAIPHPKSSISDTRPAGQATPGHWPEVRCGGIAWTSQLQSSTQRYARPRGRRTSAALPHRCGAGWEAMPRQRPAQWTHSKRHRGSTAG